MSVRTGEILLEHATRGFSIGEDRPRTLKELLIGRRGGGRKVYALRDVDLRVGPGEAVGIVGRNGAGKTSLLRVLAGIIPLEAGRSEVQGRIASLLELGAGFSDDFTGRENIHLSAALHGLTRSEIEERIDDMIAFSELDRFIDVPIRSYSSGMFLRLGFSIAAHIDADVLLVDEILAVGDEAFQRKCLRRISDQMSAGATLVIVSHDPATIERVCERVVVLDDGQVAFDGQVAEGILTYHRMIGTETGAGASLRSGQGAGALEITDVSVLDGDGGERRVFRTGEELRLELTVAEREQVVRPGLALEIRDTQGAIAFRTDIALDAVPARLRYRVPELGLLGGDYDLAVSAYDQDDSTRARSRDRVVRFSVAQLSSAEGIADLRGEWDLGPVAHDGGRDPHQIGGSISPTPTREAS